MDMLYTLSQDVDGKRVSYPLHTGRNTIGSLSRSSDITLHIEGVSRSHAAIDIREDGVRIIDLNSKNGTFVNGQRVDEHVLHVGDTIHLGAARLRFDNGSGRHAGDPAVRPNAQTAGLDVSYSLAESVDTPTPGRARGRVFNTMLELGGFLVSDEDSEDVYCDCLKHVANLFRFRRACLIVLNDGGTPDIRSCYPSSLDLDDLDISLSMIEEIVREHRPLLVGGAQGRSLSESAVFKGIRSAVAVPLFHGTQVLGALYLDHHRDSAYEERHLQRLQLLGNLIAAKISQSVEVKAMRSAAEIQSSMLCKVPARPPCLQVGFRLEPSAAVGGDLYETLELPDGRYLYAIGDVSGHHYDAALAMSNILSTMRALAPLAQSPLQLVEDVERLIRGCLPRGGFVTLFVGFFDPQTRAFHYVNAGHDPPVLFLPDVEGAPFRQLDSTGPLIGMDIPVPLEAAHIELPAGAMLCAWSDGVFEAARPGVDPEQFSRERLIDLLSRLRNEPVDTIIDKVFAELRRFLGDARIRDDCTMLVLRSL
jgi:sigma-B regulation protein RsbU (phosphoserine phosphatase)